MKDESVNAARQLQPGDFLNGRIKDLVFYILKRLPPDMVIEDVPTKITAWEMYKQLKFCDPVAEQWAANFIHLLVNGVASRSPRFWQEIIPGEDRAGYFGGDRY